jgi:pimeloyl-ACP methyl ester carboxylesterase
VTALRDDEVALPGGPRLAVRVAPGPRRPFLLVHGLSSNARLWDGVARRLVEAGHEVVAVDQRGHGRSEQVADGYTTEQCAADLAALCAELGLTGDRAPVSVGQSWGGNVVLAQAARHGGVAGLALVDGGWIALSERFATFEECWAALAPPVFDGLTLEDFAGRLRTWHPDWPPEGIEGTLANFRVRPDGTAAPRLAREHHRDIVRSLFEGDPRLLYPNVRVPTLLAPAVPAGDLRRAGPRAALELLPDVTVSWYEGADHDLHAQQPDRLAADLLALVDRVEAARR